MAQQQQRDDYAEAVTDEGSGAKGKGDYSPHASSVAQQQQRDHYAGAVTDKGGCDKGQGDYSPHAGPVAQQQQRTKSTPRP